ncbi:MAG: InlB B-repeat-containing protein [Firmicutes bacterium]|nr:InlB B-repeat-containing protein [Bacillota bacterium]
MFYAKHRSRRKKMKFVKGIAMLLCLVTIFTSVWVGNLGIGAEDGDRSETVKITVNYVYKSNNAMVAQPYTAQIEKGASFKKTLEVPKLFNYSIPNDEAIGLDTDSIVLTKDEATGKYSLAFDLQSVNENVEVTLYYVAGTAKYTVYHYYQNLENDKYTLDPKIVELTGDIDAYTEAVANSREGFRCEDVPQYVIAADGSTSVEIYYKRLLYTVTFDVNGGIDGPEPIFAKFGTTFEADSIQKPTREGYTFLGWSPVLSDTVTIEKNITYVAQWQAEKGQADYTIVLWGQNANDDEYSYLSSHEAWGNVGNQVTWNDNPLINHVHTDECGAKYCKLEEHTHSDACGYACSHAPGHVLRPDCFGLSVDLAAVDPNNGYGDNDARTHFEDECSRSYCKGLKQYLKNGSVCQYKDGNGGLFGLGVTYEYYYFFYLNGQYYEITKAQYDSMKSSRGKSVKHDRDTYYVYEGKITACTHTHAASCYSCGITEHTHSEHCCGITDTAEKHMQELHPGSNLWEYDHSDTVTVSADGMTVLNVYFTRKVFKLQFRKRNSNNNDFGTIEARWGKNIEAEYKEIVKKAGSSFWSERKNAEGPWTNYIGVMPQRDITYYRYITDGYGTSTMTYYGEDLNGVYQKIFDITFDGTNYTVTDEDRYQFEGYTFDHGTANGANCNGAEFYYKRNSYALEFYSANTNTPDRTETPKFQETLGRYYYRPVEKPDTVEPDAVFVGWYLNPECTGEEYDISAHTMPANNIALYAKWVNGLYTVRTYTDDTLRTPYTYEGYSGVQGNIEKYTLATAPTDPKKDGCVFVGWFYKDGEAEKPFSFTMPITRNYDLYPKFDDQVSIEYTVHYYKAGTTEKVADDKVNTVKIGTTVTEKAKMGTELNLLSEVMQKKYYPAKTSTSEVIKVVGQEIIFYYTEAASVKYTVYYQDANGKNLKDPVTKTTEYSTVTEPYLPIDGYAPHQFSITKDMSADPKQNKIVFIYYPTLTTLNIRKTGFDAADAGTTFIFRIKGTDENTKNIDLMVTIHGYVSGGDVPNVTVADLPVGSYTVTEESDWSWRYQPKNGEQTQTITLDPDGAKNVLTFENERKDGQWLSGDAYNTNLYKPDSN